MNAMNGDGAAPASWNTAALVRGFAKTHPNLLALVDKRTGRSRTFAELAKDLDETAAGLRAAGIKPGDRTALFVATGIEFVTLFYATLQVGAVPVLIDPGMGTPNMLNCIREQQPTALVGIAKAHVLRLGASSAFRSVKAKVLVGGAFFPGAQPLDKLKKQGTDTSVHAPAPEDTGAILYTSGSTGAPKGVVYAFGMSVSQVSAIRDMMDIRPGDDLVTCFLPFGLFSVAMGMTTVFPDMDFRFPARADPSNILAALEGATGAFASPALWEPFSRFLEEKNVTLPGLKRVLTAGAPVRPQLHERLLKHLPNGDVFTPYGATEALPVAIMNGRRILEETAALTRQGKGTCVGALAPGVEVKIVAVTDEPIATMKDARELPRGETGEIVVRGPCVTCAYDTGTSSKGAEANRAAKIVDGDGFWHRMGDVGYLDGVGRLWFCGRKGHRVETPHGMLSSIPVEAVAETVWPERAALVGLGPRGKQHAVVILEAAEHKPRFVRDTQLAALRALPGCAHISDVLLHVGAFPVDRRHNAKIEREKLADFAAQRLPQLAQGVTT